MEINKRKKNDKNMNNKLTLEVVLEIIKHSDKKNKIGT